MRKLDQFYERTGVDPDDVKWLNGQIDPIIAREIGRVRGLEEVRINGHGTKKPKEKKVKVKKKDIGW